MKDKIDVSNKDEAMPEKDAMLRVGVITSAHGLKGEAKVFPTTDDAHRYDRLEKCYIDRGSGRSASDGLIKVRIEGVKYLKKMVIVKFDGINDINDIEKYKGCDILITRDDAVELAEGEYFIADLIGLSVVTDTGEHLGMLADVMKTGANDVYVVKPEKGGKEILLPVIDECVLDIDIAGGYVRVHVPDGLL